jgi:hypothetical protein
VRSAIRAAVYPLLGLFCHTQCRPRSAAIWTRECYSRQLLRAVTPLTGEWPHPGSAFGAGCQRAYTVGRLTAWVRQDTEFQITFACRRAYATGYWQSLDERSIKVILEFLRAATRDRELSPLAPPSVAFPHEQSCCGLPTRNVGAKEYSSQHDSVLFARASRCRIRRNTMIEGASICITVCRTARRSRRRWHGPCQKYQENVRTQRSPCACLGRQHPHHQPFALFLLVRC